MNTFFDIEFKAKDLRHMQTVILCLYGLGWKFEYTWHQTNDEALNDFNHYRPYLWFRIKDGHKIINGSNVPLCGKRVRSLDALLKWLEHPLGSIVTYNGNHVATVTRDIVRADMTLFSVSILHELVAAHEMLTKV